MNKKGIVFLLLFIFAIYISVGTITIYSILKSGGGKEVKFANGGDISRYEWIEMLCEQTGITEYQNEIPYFSDVNKNNVYFSYLQSAIEWEILDSADNFDGENYASGRFVALTAMKTIGERKLQIYLDTKNSIADDDYIKLAIEHGLIEEHQLSEGLSLKECDQVMDTLKSLYFGEFWRDDYSHVIYQNGVIELSSSDVLQSNKDGSVIVVADNIRDSLKIGTIIVFEQENIKLKVAREITGIDSDGTLSLGLVELDQVVESLTVSDITELTFSDIVNYYESEEKYDAINTLYSQQDTGKLINTKVFPFEIESEGYKLSLSTTDEDGDKYLEIIAIDNATGMFYDFPMKYEVEADSEYSAEINIDNIYIGGQADYYSFGIIPNYVEVAVDAHATFNGTIKTDTEKKILLFKTIAPLGSEIAGVDIQLYLVISAEGSVSFEAELPMEMSVCFEKNKGLKNFKNDISVNNPTIEANCDIGVMLRFEPTLILLRLNAIDIEADIGVTASANVTTRPNSQICADISASFPVMTISVCGDEDADTIVGDLGFSAEWEIISSENAPIQIGMHYEILSDKTTQFVKNCTYVEEEKKGVIKKPKNVKENTSVNTYYTRYGEVTQTNSPIFSFDYPDNWSISKEEVNGSSTAFEEYAEEVVELTNERGVKVTFIKFDSFLFEAGGSGHFYVEYQAEKMTDARSVLPNDSTKFVVAKLTEEGAMIAGVDSDLESPDSERVSYALMPENDIDRYDGSLSAMGALTGYCEMISFDYPAPYVFFAEAPNGQFTKEEEKEVIEILSSFRLADDKILTAGENGVTLDEEQIYIALQNGDFSYFAGTYKPCGIYNEWYGGGEDINYLILHENGVASGGGPWYNPDFYIEEEPISVTKREDGSYLCQLSYIGDSVQEYFIIYPKGVIGETPYIYNDPLLTETPYIHYFVSNGEKIDIIYYKIEE